MCYKMASQDFLLMVNGNKGGDNKMILNKTGKTWQSFKFRLISNNLVRTEYRNWQVAGLWRILDLRLN